METKRGRSHAELPDEADRGWKRDEQVDELMDALGRMLSR
jgi:hypothetical protein